MVASCRRCWFVLAVEQLDLGAQDGERRAKLVRRVGHEIALAPERALEPVEHAVEGFRQHANLARGVPRPGAHRQVTRVDGCGDPRDTTQRRGDQRCERGADRDGERERDQPEDEERTSQARLRVRDRGERVGDPQRPDDA